MLVPDQGHGFAKPASRLKFYPAADSFLAALSAARRPGGPAARRMAASPGRARSLL